ncbi:sensor histidine kinase [Mucilaginibacter aquariorum]|uniref:Histidine kinase n=1 Tax=Mucilaginibacter aquariorum TaxID=2967225 RepID=A0ABT1SWM7_9SPHI|nr:histidine kinase [Mucilaginibacter aquariorum]MCQ6956496.1 histidine kinase [Mucilaginibacter aquariorum]
MKKYFAILLNIGFWACYFILIGILIALYNKSSPPAGDHVARMTNAFKNLFLFAILPSAITYILYYLVLFPKYLQQRKFWLALAFGLAIAVGAAVLSYILHRYLIETGRVLDMDEGGKNGRSTAVKVIMVTSFINLIAGVIALSIKGFTTWVSEIRLKELLKEKNYEMEMALVKSQLDPHLLFNTINNIDALILKDAVKASNYLNQLSGIMRFILYETKTEQILLHKEVEYLEKYIALQKIRTANQNYVNFSVTGVMGNKLIAPMVFIPFIENAFKHTNNKKIENAITIDIFVNDDNVRLLCANKFDPRPSARQPDSGLGNELIRKRLDLLYKGKHSLRVDKTNELYSIDLMIPNG